MPSYSPVPRFVRVAIVLAASISLLGLIGLSMSTQAAPPAPALLSATPCGGFAFRQVPSADPYSEQNYFYGVATVGANDAWAVGGGNTGFGSYNTLVERWNGTDWVPVASPNPIYDNVLRAVAVVAANDAWAVGDGLGQPVIFHWNGSAWTSVAGPNFGSDYVRLFGVTAIAANDVWAVGRRFGSSYSSVTLHWNGTAWSEVLSGRIVGEPGYPTGFYGVSALASNEVWAVGTIAEGVGQSTLVARWNGTTWTRIPTPNLSTSENYLRAVVVLAPDDVWAVGYYGGTDDRSHTLALRWLGGGWAVVPTPDPTLAAAPAGPSAAAARPDGSGGIDLCRSTTCYGNFLFGLAASGPYELWAGGFTDTQNGENQTLTLHWDGFNWTQVPSDSPSPVTLSNRLYAVASPGPGDAWAVGFFESGVNQYASLIERYGNAPCLSPTPTATATPCVPGTFDWTVVASPNSPSDYHVLNDVGVVSADDIWAVGEYYNINLAANVALIEHWDGTSWSFIVNPFTDSLLQAIKVINANDIWAVGYGYNGPLTAHWNGSTWSRVGNPAVGPGNRLWGVSGLTSNDVWAVGELEWEQGPLILHWNGTAWSRATLRAGLLPEDNTATHLEDVAAAGPNDVWAVGTLRFSNSNHTLIMHYDGTAWTLANTPSPGVYTNQLRGVAVVAPNDVWAVGYYRNTYDETNKTLVLHWNGTTWSVVPSPNPTAAGPAPGQAPTYDGEGDMLFDLAAVSTTELWAVGTIGGVPYGDHGSTLVLRWDGAAWTQANSASPNTGNILYGVDVVGPSDAWAVGTQFQGSQSYTLIERYGPPCGAITPVATRTVAPATSTRSPTAAPSQTPGGPSATPTHPAATATVTPIPPSPTVCPVQFVDVPSGHPFYTYIRCLACRGIVSGYPCGGPGEPCPGLYFRPANNVTRGQLSKIIASAAGFNETIPSTQQSFEDIPGTDVFWLWIERLASRRVIGGYPCGGVGEPCIPPLSRAYFRATTNATRGQIAKIVANAANFNEAIPTNQQTFEDVPYNATFWQWIERMADRGIINGYPCGSPGEPCVGPQNRPYFRPETATTRGQMSKIAANTFFSNCQTPSYR